MGTRTVANPIELQGYSTNDKPSASDGSTYHILDTGEVLVAHEGDWVPDKRLAYALKLAAYV